MIVSDLIKILQALPEDAEVLWGDKVEPERSQDVAGVELCLLTVEGWPIPNNWAEEDGDADNGTAVVIWPEDRRF